jgi:trigger factor
MQIDVKELEPCKLQIRYETDTLSILNKRAEVINHFKKAPVPGFRPGKASVDAIKVHYKDQIEEALKRALAEDAYHDTLFEKKFRAHGAPKFNMLSLGDGKFTCEFEMYTKPDFTLAEYKNMEIPKPAAEITANEMCERMLQELRVRLGEVSPFQETDFVQVGDSVIIDYKGAVDGESVEALTAEGEMLTVGSSPVPDFDNNLLGMTLGETRKFDLLIPESALPSYAGKTATFEVTLVMGSKTTPCPLDDSLAQKVGKQTYAELRAEVMGTASARTESATRMELVKAVSNKVVSDNIIDVPHWMTLSEAQYLAHKSNMDWNTMEDADKERFLDVSEKNVKLSLILDKVREEEPEAQLTDQEVFDMIKSNLSRTRTDKPIDQVIEEMNRTGYMQILFSRIRDEYTLDFLVKNAKIVE